MSWYAHTGYAAAVMSSQLVKDACQHTLKVAFDLDAVLFSAESEVHYKQGGLSAFFKHERANANKLVDEVKIHSYIFSLHDENIHRS